MAQYTDLAAIEALYREQAQIEQALTILDEHDGTVSSYTVSPVSAPYVAGAPMPPTSVLITTTDPGQSLIAGVRSSLVQRYNAINHELRDLGVEGGPPDHAQGPQEATIA